MADRLYKSRTDRMVTGVSGGIAEHLDVDPTLIRVGWVLISIFTGGLAILAYIVLAFIMPERASKTSSASTGEDAGDGESEHAGPSASGPVSGGSYANRRGTFGIVVGAVLIVIGGIFLGFNFGLFDWWDWGRFWPIILIVLGLLFIAGRIGGRDRDG